MEAINLESWPTTDVEELEATDVEELEATKKDLEANDFMALLCSIPVEGAGTLLDRKRSEGSTSIPPKIAIISMIKWMELHGYTRKNWDFYDIDMLYPSDEELREYFNKLQPQVVGLSTLNFEDTSKPALAGIKASIFSKPLPWSPAPSAPNSNRSSGRRPTTPCAEVFLQTDCSVGISCSVRASRWPMDDVMYSSGTVM